MFERFTDRARSTVVLAQEEARNLQHNYIGTEHVLLGLLRERDGLAAQALQRLGVSVDGAREQVLEIIGRGNESPTGHIPFTPRAKKVLELALREALQLSHNYIGTEHILLGLVREGEGVAANVLVRLGADLDRVRKQVVKLLAEGPGGGAVPPFPTRRRTPAAEQVLAVAAELAGDAPIGSHHLLEALALSPDSAAAKALAALGTDAEAVSSKLDELGLEGTTDLTDEEAAARRMEIHLVEGEAHIVLRDEATLALTRSVIDNLGGPVRGDDPLAGSLVGLHQAVSRFLTDLQARLEPPDDEDAESGGGVSEIIKRAVRARLRRRA